MRNQPARRETVRRESVTRASAPGGAPRKKAGIAGPAALIAAAALATIGLFQWTKAAAGAPATYLAAADVSMSQTKEERRQYLNVLDSMVATTMAPGSSLKVWSFDLTAGKLYEGEPRKPADIFELEDGLIGYVSKTRGTTPSSVLPELIAAATKETRPVVVTLFWDAEDVMPEKSKPLIAELAKNENIRALWILGLPPMAEDRDARSRVEAAFSAFGDRLIVSSGYDMKVGMERLRSRLKS